MSATSRAGRAMAGGATPPAAPRCLASHACGAARSGHRAGSRSGRSARSQRGCSGPSSPASRARAAPESAECPCRAQADGSRSCGEAYAGERFTQPRCFRCLLEQPSELACRQRPMFTATGKQPTLFRREASVIRGCPRLPPLPQQVEDLRRQHHVPVLEALRLHDADDHLLTVDVARPQPHHLARPQSATIGECQHRSRLQARRHAQNTLDLLRAEHWRQLLRFLDVPDLSRQIVATQRDAEQKPHPGHDPITVADARSALDEVQLETPHLVGRRCVGRTFQPRGEPLAARNVAALSVRVELACSHVLDHAPTQRTNSFSVAHGEFHLSEVDDTSILRTGLPWPLWPSSQLATGLSPLAPRSGLERSDFVHWHTSAVSGCLHTFPLLEVERLSLRGAGPSRFVESPGGISPPGAPRTVHDPLESHGSRCSAVAIERLCLVHRLLLLPVGQWARPNNAAPSLQPHYRAFDATTGCSAPAPRFGTLALAVGAACGLSLHVIGVTKQRFARSIRKPGRASRRLHAGCCSGSIRASPELIPEEGSPPGSDIA